MLRFTKILTESIKLALNELINNKLRTFLSLLGITVGIFCIISIFTAVDFLNNSIDSSFKELGEKVVYVQKFPWAMEEDYPWWEYIKRPQVDYEVYKRIKKETKTASDVAFFCYYKSATAKSKINSLKRIGIFGITPSFQQTMSLKVDKGRFFSEIDNRGSRSVVVGGEIAKELFKNVNPLGQTIRIDGKQFNVIGVLKSSDNLFNIVDFEQTIMMPHEVGRTMFKVQKNSEQWVATKAKDNILVDQMKDELRGILRSVRGIRPVQKDNFSMNRVTIILEAMKSTKRVLKITGLILGTFSLLIGGFGVANIMFVSVRERTKYIGIKKAIGAKKWVILIEFLIEAVFLCLLGCLFGLLIVFSIIQALNHFLQQEFVLSLQNILIGLGFSIGIGLLAGIIPAYIAANMNPVKAIRS